MKIKIFALGLFVLFATGCAEQALRSQSIAQPTVQAQSTTTSTPSRSGKFVKAEHETLGGARIVTENGAQFIEFDPAFKTDSGPDLFVILTRPKQPPITGIQEQDYRSLGALQKVSGTQRYEIPADLNLAEFASVAIWCRQFNATFGYAQLSP